MKRTSDDLRTQLAAGVTRDFNSMVANGQITGVRPLPTPPADPEGMTAINRGPLPNSTSSPQPPTSTAVPANPEAATTQPAPTEPAPAEPASPATPGSTGDAPRKLFLGKYETEEAAEKGHYELQNYAATISRKLAAYETGQGPTPTPASPQGSALESRSRANPADPRMDWRSDPAVMKAAEEAGMAPEAFADLAARIHERTMSTIDSVVGQRLGAVEADLYMQTTYPDAKKHAPEIQAFVEQNPMVQGGVRSLLETGNTRAALDYAYNMYQVNLGNTTQADMQATATAADATRQTERAAAGLPSTPSTPVHAAIKTPVTPDPELLTNLQRRGEAGDAVAARDFRRLTLGTLLPAELRTWERRS